MPASRYASITEYEWKSRLGLPMMVEEIDGIHCMPDLDSNSDRPAFFE